MLQILSIITLTLCIFEISSNRLKVDPCSKLTCAGNEICVLEQVQCITQPCPPIASCQPIKLDPLFNPCSNITCPKGEICKLHDVVCIRAPCPPIPQCEPQVCSTGDPLIVEYTGEPVICKDTIGNDCPKPFNCQCSLAGDKNVCCPPDQGDCPFRKCAHNCKYYRYDADGCRTCDCLENPCLNHQCKRGEVCVLQQVQCIQAPCPQIATCVHECPLRNCVKNCDYYEFDKDGCRTCTCIDDPCKSHICNKGEKCILRDVFCIRAPCPPIPTCVKKCAVKRCSKKCDYYKYDSDGCRICQCYNPCETVKCTAETECVVEPVVCKKAPCYPRAICAPIEPECDA